MLCALLHETWAMGNTPIKQDTILQVDSASSTGNTVTFTVDTAFWHAIVHNAVIVKGNINSENALPKNLYILLLIGYFVGFVLRTIYDTLHGIKNKFNGSPITFIFSYWIKDNSLQKLAGILSILPISQVLSKFAITDQLIYKILFVVFGLILGWAIDTIYDWLKTAIIKK